MALNLDERLGLCSWSLEASNPAELIERVKACGVGFVQLVLNPIHDQPEVWGDTAKQLADAGIGVRSGMFGCVGEDYSTLETIRKTGGLVPDHTWPQNQKIVEAALEDARPFGLKLISTHVGFIPEDANSAGFRRIVERVQWVADRFATEGVSLLMETGQETADDLWTFIEAVDRPNVGVNFDPANMILYAKGDPVEALRRLMPRVWQVHIKDAVATKTPGTWGTEVPVGDGDVDWPTFLNVLEEADYQGDLVVEREAGGSRVEEIRLANARLKEWLAEGRVGNKA